MLDKAVQATHLVPGGRYDAGVRERIETVIRKQEERLVNSAVSAAMRSVKPVRTGLLPADETSGRFLAWLESGTPLPAGSGSGCPGFWDSQRPSSSTSRVSWPRAMSWTARTWMRRAPECLSALVSASCRMRSTCSAVEAVSRM